MKPLDEDLWQSGEDRMSGACGINRVVIFIVVVVVTFEEIYSRDSASNHQLMRRAAQMS